MKSRALDIPGHRVLCLYRVSPGHVGICAMAEAAVPHCCQISPSVSIVLAVRNGMALLPWKMAHLFNLDYPNIQEIIVVSDGSTDGTAEFLGRLADPRLKKVLLEDHCGKAVALNAGMKQATADVIVFFDIRPGIAPGAIQRLVIASQIPRWVVLPANWFSLRRGRIRSRARSAIFTGAMSSGFGSARPATIRPSECTAGSTRFAARWPSSIPRE